MNTKFNPKDVPNWCKWIAVDDNGDCYCYDARPVKMRDIGGEYWNGSEIRGERQIFLYHGKPPKNWREELYTWGY